MIYETGYIYDPGRFSSFNALAVETFGLDLAPWQQSGAPDGCYQPHSFFEDGRCLSNVSATRMTFLHQGELLTATQLGTVMTAPDHRGQGLAGDLLERVLRQTPDAFRFLFAAKERHSFYEAHGFAEAEELTVCAADAMRGKEYAVRRLELTKREDLGILTHFALHAAPQSQHLQPLGSRALETFHLLGGYKKCAYFYPNCAAVLILEKEGSTVTVCHAYAAKPHDAAWFARRAWSAFPKAQRVVFGFLPAGWEKGQITVTKHELMTAGGLQEPLCVPPLART